MAEMIKKCPECGGINLFWNREKGEIICRECGLVIEDKMVDFTQEWREFDSDEGEAKRRTGAPMTSPSMIRDSEQRLARKQTYSS